jgi:hypothetical protein
MKLGWLTTTAIALLIGTGAVIAQSQTDQKRDETPRAQAPSKNETGGADPRQGRSAQPDQKGPQDPRGQAGTSGDRKQAQEHQPGDAKQPRQQSRDRTDGADRPAAAQGRDQNDRPAASPTQQSQDQRKSPDAKQQKAEPSQQGQSRQDRARDAKQPDQKQQTGQPAQRKQDDQARDTDQPGDQKRQSGQQQQPAQQPSATQTQQGARPNDTNTGQTRDQTTTSSRTGPSASTNIDERQRTEVVDRLRRDRSASSRDVNIRLNIGVQLPSRARVRPLPQDIVRIMPQYRGYQYTVVNDEVVVVEPRTRRVVEVIRDPGSSTSVRDTSRSGSVRISISSEQRETLRQSARRMTTAPTSGGSGSLSDTSCLQLQAIPDELARSNPELGSYRMLAIGQQVILVDPRDQKIVEVIE